MSTGSLIELRPRQASKYIVKLDGYNSTGTAIATLSCRQWAQHSSYVVTLQFSALGSATLQVWAEKGPFPPAHPAAPSALSAGLDLWVSSPAEVQYPPDANAN